MLLIGNSALKNSIASAGYVTLLSVSLAHGEYGRLKGTIYVSRSGR